MKSNIKLQLFVIALILSLALPAFAWPWSKPEPQVFESKLETNLFSPNVVNAVVQNKGSDGWVLLSYYTTDTSTSFDIKRRSGAEVWFRRNLTSGDDSEYYFDVETNTRETGRWQCCSYMKADQVKRIRLEMPNHTGSDNQFGPFVVSLSSQPKNVTVK